MKRLLLALACAMSLYAQVPACDDNTRACRHLYFYDGSSNLQYDCRAALNNATTSWKRTTSTLTSIAVLTNVGTVTTSTAHALSIGDRVTVSGATAAAGLNATYTIATVPSSTTFTIATTGVADATYTESTLVLSTTAPPATSPVWSIRVYTYSGTTLASSGWADGRVSATLRCSDRANY